METLQAKLSELATELDVPGVAAGVYQEGNESYAYHGVTSIENPLPVDEGTLFQFGSTGKTYTSTAIMRLVERGLIDLDAPVRTYVPELKLKEEDVARRVTVLQLLNHTAGWTGDAPEDFGEGDDARARFVESMAGIEQVTPLGSTVSYNNASLNLAGRVIEKVTGQTYEAAMKELIFDPLSLDHTFFFNNDIMTRRFVVGHRQDPDGTIHVARPWALPRAGSPAGGISSNARDQIAWARFHLGDGSPLLTKASLDRMKQPTVEMPGSAIGDAVGISWLLRDIQDGAKRLPRKVRTVGHGGTTIGQYSAFRMVPERDFAIISMTNCGPNGSQLNRRLGEWALEAYLGVVDSEPERVARTSEELGGYVGTYESASSWVDISAQDGGLVINLRYKPETIEQLEKAGEDIPEPRPIPLGFIGDDRYVVSDGAAKGMRGYFVRSDSGDVCGVHLGGRLATRTAAAVSV